MKIDLHGYYPAVIVFNGTLVKTVQQTWEMGEDLLTLIHGHGSRLCEYEYRPLWPMYP
jgi:hypothetical protein